MKGRLYHFSLRSADFGQLIDGLCARRDSWAETAKWFRGECKDPFFMIEECRDEEEAQEIADHYSEIIENLQAQAAPQRKRKCPEPVARPAPGTLADGWCLYADTLCAGVQPVERSEDGFWVYASKREAEEAWAENLIDRCHEFLRGERETEEVDSGLFVVPVTLHPDGTVADENNEFTP
ncbi:hypothetical protein [Luteolibacter sp. Populi]|uniref:hypothetical protein n=1 Tax=Luteolibacter sp. Populi TaxID=3230487 RepID=UPI003467A93B